MPNKRGESLVEVVVALGILAFVFMGVVNIIAGSITLNMSSRQRTEMVAKTQKNLNEYLAMNTGDGACSVVNIQAPTGGVPVCATGALTNTGATCEWITVSDLGAGEIVTGYNGTTKNFKKVTSHSKWYTRIIGEQEFEINRLVRNN